MKSVQIRSFFWSVFFRIRTEYFVSLRIQSECRKIRTRNNSVSGHISHIVYQSNTKLSTIKLWFIRHELLLKCFLFLWQKENISFTKPVIEKYLQPLLCVCDSLFSNQGNVTFLVDGRMVLCYLKSLLWVSLKKKRH